MVVQVVLVGVDDVTARKDKKKAGKDKSEGVRSTAFENSNRNETQCVCDNVIWLAISPTRSQNE